MTGSVLSGTWRSGGMTWINQGREECHRHTVGVKYYGPYGSFKMYKGFAKMDICELFTKDVNFKGTRGHTLKLEKPGCWMHYRDSRKFFFSHRVISTLE